MKENFKIAKDIINQKKTRPMKKIALIAFSLIIAFTSLQAQSPSKDMKKASKLFGSYNLDPASNGDKLNEAYTLINGALEDETVAGMAKSWLVKGKILNEMSNEEIKRKILDPNYKLVNPNSALEAFEAFDKGYSLAEKSYRKKEALKALLETENHLNNYGIYAFQDKDYPAAYMNFDAATSLFKMLTANEKGAESRLNDPAVYSEHIFYTAVSAYYGEMKTEAKPYLLELFNAGTEEAMVYESLYVIESETNEEEALSYLAAGRTKFPQNTGLLFAEINHYVKKGEMEKMIDKLETALELEPDNVSIYTTLGSVYDNLSTKSTEEGDKENAQVNFDKALGYFNKALELEPENFDAIYSIGALYYNAAANMTKEINEFANDFSKEGTKKYNEIKAVMDNKFEESLPYFEKAEKLNPNDGSVLQALSEIYARKNMLDKSVEYKERIEALGK
jgi:tetratricopeptide (TPR) repeat protein